MIKVFRLLGLIEWRQKGDYVVTNNFTLINLVLRIFGPVHESTLAAVLIGLQCVCSVFAFFVRYPLASFFYDV